MPRPPWLQNLEDYYWIHDILRVSVGLPAWAMIWDGKAIDWRDLSLVLPPLAPYHFEIAMAKEGERDRYYQRMLRKVLDSGKPAVGSLHGYDDLFVPMGRMGAGGAVLYIGQFARRAPSWAGLCNEWRELSRRDAVATDKDFHAYVETALKVPVLHEKALKGLVEFATLYAGLLRGETQTDALEPKLDRLRKRYFTPYIPHPVWAYQAIGFDPQRPVPWYPGPELSPWMKEELGLSQVPLTVLSLLPLHADPLKARVINRAIHLAAWVWCRKKGELICEPMREEGLAFLSPESKKPALRDLAGKIRDFVQSEFKIRCVIGIGSPVPKGERLYSSYAQAAMALQYALQVEKPLLFHDELPATPGSFEYASLARAAGELFAVFELGMPEPLGLAVNEYVRLLLEYSGQRLELMRGQFLAALFQLVEITRRRHSLRPEQLRQTAIQLSHSIESAQNSAELFSRFKGALQSLARLGSQGKELSVNLRLQGTLAWMNENFSRPIRLLDAAGHAGLSVPGFTRAFRRATGSAFLPWLTRLRSEYAARLLRSGDISVLECASVSGFSSSQHLIRAFHGHFGTSPGKYRKKAQKGL